MLIRANRQVRQIAAGFQLRHCLNWRNVRGSPIGERSARNPTAPRRPEDGPMHQSSSAGALAGRWASRCATSRPATEAHARHGLGVDLQALGNLSVETASEPGFGALPIALAGARAIASAAMRTSLPGGRALRVCGVLCQTRQAKRAGIARRSVRGADRCSRRGGCCVAAADGGGNGQAGIQKF